MPFDFKKEYMDEPMGFSGEGTSFWRKKFPPQTPP